jgi:hypothetical protein
MNVAVPSTAMLTAAQSATMRVRYIVFLQIDRPKPVN